MNTVSVALAAAVSLSFVSLAFAQQPSTQPDPVTLHVSRAELALIGQGIMKLPYEQAAPLLNELQKQLNEQAPAPAKAEPGKK